MPVRITKNLVPQVLKAIEDLTRQQVLVGIPGDAAARTGRGAAITNAQIGYIQEFGSPAQNIPARPFLRPGVNDAMPDIIARLRNGAKLALKFPLDPDAGTKALMAAGLVAQRSVQMTITNVIPPPLSPVTIQRRRTRKVAPRIGTVPLIDTGALRRSITYTLRNKTP